MASGSGDARGAFLAAATGVAAGLVAVAVLAGWALNAAFLTRVTAAWPALLPATALGALLLSVLLVAWQGRKAFAAMTAGDERLRLIIEGALDAVVTIDRNGCITDWNAHAEFMFGWARGEVLGRELAATIIPPQYVEAHRAGLRRYSGSGESRVMNRRVELSALHRSGREFPIEITITPLQTAGGVVFCAFVRDITARREAQLALEASEARFRTLAESLPNLVWTCRPDGWCDFLSRQWVEYTGKPEAEQLGYGWTEQLHPDDRERASTEWAAATARGDLFDIEFRIRRYDGKYRWFRTRAIPLRDAMGDLIRWFGSNTDIEDYKQAQLRLGMQIERMHLLDHSTRAIAERQDLRSILQAVLDSLESGRAIDYGCFCTVDPAGHALTVYSVGSMSSQFTPVLEMPEGTRIGIDHVGLQRTVGGSLVHEPDVGANTSPFARRFVQAGLHAIVLAPQMVEGRVFGVLVAARREAHSFSSGDCEFLRQLSEHVALAARQAELYGSLQAAYEDLRRTQQSVLQQERIRALGQMASGIAHDINNALSPAAMYVQRALESSSALSEQARAELRVVEGAIDSVAQTIGRLREYYREHEPSRPDEPVDVNTEVRKAVELTRARWHDMPQQRGAYIEIGFELAEELPAMIGAAGELRDAVINLILNAIDAMPQGGRLALRTRARSAESSPPAGPTVEIAVRDTGIGMDEEARRRCLEPFYTTKGERGTGLGLAMVFGMIERRGGSIEIDSEPGRGTEVRLVLPQSRTAVQLPAAKSVAAVAPQRIVIVDDDALVLKSLREILEADGHQVTAADGGQAGIDALLRMEAEGQPCTMLVTDLGMPHVDGRRVAAAAKSLQQPPPVVLLTGWGQRLKEDGDIPPHVDRVLSKPPRLAEIRAAFAQLLG